LAQKARVLADNVRGAETKRTMREIAAAYDKLAERAEAAERKGDEEQE
jgi:hypothetical protein